MVTNETEQMDTHEAAKYLAVSVPTLKRWRQRNEGPPFLRVGPRAIRYVKEDIDSWLDTRRTAAT
jgi:excisionase family DNA binding protein